MKTVTMMLNEHLITLSPLEIGMLVRKNNHLLATARIFVITKQMFHIQVLIRLFSISVLIDSYVVQALREFLSTALFSQGHIYRGRGGAGE